MTDTAARQSGPEVTEVVHVTIDGNEVSARPGELLIDAAERAGTFIPRFCYHPRMEPVGMCRMCLVEVSGPRGFSLQPACYIHVAEGQEVLTSSAKARKAQEGVLELLLVNHPLDCPVCDKGGECPLQDQALSHGPGESRFIEEKRHWAKPIEIGPLTYLDRERCIQCARCTRFSAEVAGDALIDFAERGDRIEVAPFPTQPFDSYFSGNTVQICPVGALTAVPYRFKSRPWDLEQVETTCTTCSVGCRVVGQSSAGQLVRYLGVDSDPVNQSWLCDKGRYGFESVEQHRLTEPLVRREGVLQPVRWNVALSEIAAGVRDALGKGGPSSVAMIGGSRLTNEDAYTWARLAKSVIGTDWVDAQLGDGLPAELVLGLPRATIDDAASASSILLLSGDLREEVPVLFLRLREAAVRRGVLLVECSSVETSLSPLATARLAARPGEVALVASALVGDAATPTSLLAGDLEAARSALGLVSEPAGQPRGSGLVVVLGRANLAESAEHVAAAARILAAALPGARFLPVLRRANVHGALDMGLAPGLLPGRVALGDAGPALSSVWGSAPPGRGGDSRAILERAAAGDLSMLVLLGADPLADFPDSDLARRALEAVPFLVALGSHPDASSRLADVVLPLAGEGERAGTTTNLEGRVTRLAQKVVPPGVARAAWMVATELAERLGTEFGYESDEVVWEEIERVARSHRGLTLGAVTSPVHRDGLVVPLVAAPVSVLPRSRSRSVAIATAASLLRRFDPIATPGIASVEEQGAPLRAGAAQPLGGEEPARSATTQEGSAAPAGAVLLRLATGDGTVPPPEVPRADGYGLRLVVRRLLYDAGTLVQACPSLAGLAVANTLLAHPSELERLGVSSGERVKVRSSRGELVVPIAADPSLARGIALLGANQPDRSNPEAPLDAASAFTLIDAAASVNDVRLETL